MPSGSDFFIAYFLFKKLLIYKVYLEFFFEIDLTINPKNPLSESQVSWKYVLFGILFLILCKWKRLKKPC